jgi:hypothetical protein
LELEELLLELDELLLGLLVEQGTGGLDVPHGTVPQLQSGGHTAGYGG